MATPGSYTLHIYRGDDSITDIALVEPGGRIVDDLQCTSGTAVVTSATAVFVATDVGKTVTAADGSTIVDGTYINSVDSGSQVTLSANAAATGTIVASIRSLDATAYGDAAAKYKTHEDATSSTSFTVDATRRGVGIYTLTLTAATTAAMTKSGVWDLQVTVAGDVRTLVRGKAELQKDVT